MHHFQHMLSIIKDMGRKGFEDFKEGEAALLAWAKKDPAEEEVYPVHLDECIEFQQEATSWGQECVGMGLERSSTSDGEDGLELGKGWDVFKKEHIYQEATYGGSTVSQLLIFKFRDPKIYLSLT